MKKKTKWFIALLLSATVIVLAVPMLFKLDVVRSRLVDRLGSELGIDVQVADINWHWLPLPHISILNLQTANELLDITIPDTGFYPDWSTLLSKNPELGRLVLKDPQIHIKDIALGSAGALIPALPLAEIFIENGLVDLAGSGFDHKMLKMKPLGFSSVYAAIQIEPEEITFYLTGKSAASRQIRLQGGFNLASSSFLANFDCQGLNISQQITSLAQDKIIPVDTEIDLQGQIEGMDLENFKLSINGELPGFNVSHQQREFLFIPGSADFSFSKSGSDTELNIKKLELRKPGLILGGTVKKNVPAENDPPIWDLDLSATDIDLTAVRESILALLGNNKIARTVCDIVIGGTASMGAYSFKGPASDFRHLKLMDIKADVSSADIYVPFVDLQLSEAGGSIAIVNANLSGEGLRARLGNSRGNNGSLLFDLTRKSRAFKLDLDLETDLAALPPILNRLVKHEKFLTGLNRLNDISGSATGHLSIGDTLDKLVVKVKAANINARADYKRLSPAGETRALPISIHNGELDIAPKMILWQGVEGKIGQQSFQDLDGRINWDNEVSLSIDSLSASLDSASLYREMIYDSLLPESISSAISSVDGKIELSNVSLQGPALSPDKWKFQAKATAENLLIESQLLPGPAIAERTEAILNDKEISLSDSTVNLLGQPFSLSGSIKHSNLANWLGSIIINGTINDKHADWIKNKGWIPAPFFPKTPCTLADLTIGWDSESRDIRGSCVPGFNRDALPKISFDLKASAKHLLLRKLDFVTKDSLGRLSMILRQEAPTRYLYTWEGSVSNETLDALLANNPFLAGRLSGNFRLDISEKPRGTSFDGHADIKDLRWLWNEDSAAAANLDLRLDGQGDRIDLEQVNFMLNREQVSAQGLILTNPDGIRLILDLATPALSRENTLDFISGLTKMTDKFSNSKMPSRNISGKMVFNVDSFSAGKKTAEPSDAQGAVYTISPLKGEILMQSPDKVSIDFSSSKLCGVDMSGTWHSTGSQGSDSFLLHSDAAQPPLFQNFLPCIGVKQDLINGAFTLEADIAGSNGRWDRGKINVRSSKGQIHRMTLLAKVFSIVNIADVFSTGSLPDLTKEGFAYSELDIASTVKDNTLLIDRAVIRGEGLNLFSSGRINLADYDTKITILVAPLKTLDTLVSKIPIIGGNGKEKSVLTIPVGIKGNIKNPTVTLLPPEAVGEAFLNLVKETLRLPFSILSPILPGSK